MPYQDRHPASTATDAGIPATEILEAPAEEADNKRVQIIIVLGLVAAIFAALFGNLLSGV